MNSSAVVARFLAKVPSWGHPVGCWEWAAGRSVKGYGTFTYNGKNRRAHRVVYEFFVAPIPEGKWVLHHCDNPGCVRPSHLYVGTVKDNVADMIARGRDACPPALNRAKTHCPRGHVYDEANTLRYNGRRICLLCERKRLRLGARAWRVRQTTTQMTVQPTWTQPVTLTAQDVQQVWSARQAQERRARVG